MKLYEKITFLRTREGMSQEDLADKLGISIQSVQEWESDISMPEMGYIKLIAKLFEVSFDYLMNDEIDSLEKPVAPVVQKPKYRSTYQSKIGFDFYQGDIDRGYTEDSSRSRDDASEIFKIRQAEMKKTLLKIGVTSNLLLQTNVAGCFFLNSKEKYFGFYYGGNIQFLCPYENFISASSCNSGNEISYDSTRVRGVGFGHQGLSVGVASVPTPTLQQPMRHTLIISYFDVNGGTRQFKLDMNCMCKHWIYENDGDEAKLFWGVEAEFTAKRIKEILSQLSGVAAVGRRILAHEIEVEPINVEFLTATIKECAVKEAEYRNRIKEETRLSNKRRKIGKIIAAAVVVAVVAIGLLIYFL